MNRRLASALLYVLATYLFVEGLSYSCLLAIGKLRHIGYNPVMATLSAERKADLIEIVDRAKKGRLQHTSLDGPTGWVPGPPDINSAGMRDNREYNADPLPGTIRISAFGGSFVYTDEVPLEKTWIKRIDALTLSTEVLNYGVKSYGLDQAYVRYLEEGLKYHPSMVLIGHTVDDVERDVMVFLPFHWQDARGAYALAKPRFEIRDGQLTLLRNPLFSLDDYANLARNDVQVLKELGKHDYYYQNSYQQGGLDFLPSVRLAKVSWKVLATGLHEPIFKPDGSYNVRSEAYAVTAGIFDAFYRRVLEDNALPVIVVFPMSTDLNRSQKGKIRRYAPLLEHFRSKGYRFIDVQDALQAARVSGGGLFAKGGHYSPLGNQILAEYIVAQLKGWDLMEASKIRQAAQAERGRLATAVH